MDAQIVERIRKLLALSTSDNQHEAELAMKKANDLMAEHQISMTQVEVDNATKDGVVEDRHEVEGLRMKYIWVVRLGMAAARLYDCEAYNTNRLHGTVVGFIGQKADIEMAKVTFDYLFRSWGHFVETDLKEAKKWADHQWKPAHTMKFKQGHGQGYAAALLRRANELAAERHKKVSDSSETGKALVVLKNQLVNTYMKKKKFRTSRSNESSGSGAGYSAGAHRGRTVALGGEITG